MKDKKISVGYRKNLKQNYYSYQITSLILHSFHRLRKVS